MHPACVLSLVDWIRRVEPPEDKMTLFKLFVTAYLCQNIGMDGNIVLFDLKEFAERGVVPDYVQSFIRKKCYPRLVFVNNHPVPRIII